ncbi:MAG: EAL domain-containing protein [Deltaproteobacteria bacterium]|nr:EAL domain-containing protein [Deltaproteobacteria bacterium]
MKLLIVDDQADSLYMLETLLKGNDYEVVSAVDGVEALAKLRSNTIDIIISDILMPRMDGFRLCRECKKDDSLKDIPFIFYTASYTDERDEKLALSLGANGFIAKPLQPEAFIKIIKNLVDEVDKGEIVAEKPIIAEKDQFELYSERVVKQLEKKMAALEEEISERNRAEQALRKSEERLVEAQRIAHLGNWDWNIKQNELYWSDEIYRIFDISPHEFDATYEAFITFVHPDDREFVKASVDSALKEKEPYSIDHRIVLPSGAERVVHEQAEVTFDEAGVPLRMAGTVQDVTELRQSEDKLVLASKVFENAIEGVVVTDEKGNIESVNRTFTSITGYSPEEAIGENVRILKSDRHERAFFDEMWNSLIEKGRWQGEIWNRRKNGEAYPEWLNIIAIKNSVDRATRYVSIFHDITDIKRSKEEIKYQSNHDALTGLPNKLLLKDRLQLTIAHSEYSEIFPAVLFIGLDRFQNINESLGHTAGDSILQQAAKRLKACVRAGDTVARFGGDEFSFVLDSLNNEQVAVKIAMDAIKSFSEPFSVDGHELYLTASIGIALYPGDGRDAETLIKNANTAMLRAKEGGRNTYRLYTEAMNARAFHRLSLENDIRKGLDRDEFVVYYQPKVCLKTGSIVSLEALVRWQHAEKGLMPPDEFIHLSEETGLITPLGKTVLRKACFQAKRWQDAGYKDLNVAVNLSAYQLQDKNIVSTIKSVLLESKLEPERLGIEITESMIMQDVATATETLDKLHDMGIQLFIDDFGTGYSSLSYLKRFKIDALKIDKSFVNDVTTNSDDASIVVTIISMSHSLGHKVIAEGVETKAQLEFMQKYECDEIQGYLISPPLPADDVMEMLKNEKKLF